jgi:hypothetical protein
VRLVTAAVVRLVRTLAHDLSPMVRDGSRRCFGQIARLASDGADRNPQDPGTSAQDFCGFGRHRPPTYSHQACASTTADRTWTCGTRRHRVTEKRYAGANGEVKSPASALGPRSGPRGPDVEIGPAPSCCPGPRAGFPEPVDSALPGPSARRYVRTSSSFPAFASALPRSTAGTPASGPPTAL